MPFVTGKMSSQEKPKKKGKEPHKPDNPGILSTIFGGLLGEARQERKKRKGRLDKAIEDSGG